MTADADTADESDLLPLSALQHWLYCPRQCGLIHVEQAWAENRYTAEGRALHERAHEGPDETRARQGLRITRGMAVRSFALGVSGQCDVVEFHGAPGAVGRRIVPVEYKRGKPKPHRADEVQLCAQAICLEEMLRLPAGTIGEGHLYYGQPRRRTAVALDAELRALTTSVAASARAMKANGATPDAQYDAKRCDACSLIDLCQPRAMRFQKGAAAWFARNLHCEV